MGHTDPPGPFAGDDDFKLVDTAHCLWCGAADDEPCELACDGPCCDHLEWSS